EKRKRIHRKIAANNPQPNRRVGIPCQVRAGGKQQTPSEKTKMPRDGARVRRCSKKASAKRSTIKCVRHPGQTRRATNSNNNSRARVAVRSPRAKFYVASPIPLPARPDRRGGRMLSE